MPDTPVTRTIGLPAAVFMLVGYVIGASIFILPGQLAADVGPGAFVSYLIAGAIAAVASVVAAQIGSAIPVSGSIHVAAARAVAPVVGFMGVWATLIAVGVAIALVSYGLADYLAYFVPGLNRPAVALVAAAGFALLNLTPVRAAVRVQTVMTFGFLAILFVFGLGGALSAQGDLLSPLMPRGLSAVVLAAVPAYFSYSGAFVIVALGGEIRSPARTIPLALLLSFLIIAAAYTLVTFSVPALLPWQSLEGISAPIAAAAGVFLPAWFGSLVAVGAILAAATSINALVLVHARDVLAMARAQVFPATLARRTSSGVPVGAVVLVGGIGLGAVLIGGTIREYAVMAVISVMLIQLGMAVAMLRLPTAAPKEFAAAGFKLGPAARWVFGSLTIVSAVVFIGLGVADSVNHGVAYLAVLSLGLVYYYVRRAVLARRGVALDEVLASGSAAEG